MSNFRLGSASRTKLSAAHPDLIEVVERAILLTTVDFSVHECARTLARQRTLLASGASRTLNSRHIPKLPADPQASRNWVDPSKSVSHAVDLVPYVNGKLRWDWPLCFAVATAMRSASIELGIHVTWGGVWDRILLQTPPDLELACSNYVQRRKKLYPTTPVFIDGPHFELCSSTYLTKD